MKTVLALIASPRRLGNCEIVAKAISENIRQPHTLKLLRLSDFDIQPCRGCYYCLYHEGRCVIEDDYPGAARAVVEADGLILVAPTYFLGPNSCLKRFTDRGLSLYDQAEGLWGKPAVGVGIAGIPGREGYTLLGVESFLKLLFADIKGLEMAYGALPGEVFLKRENQAMAARLAKALFDENRPQQSPEPACPLCGGKTFRFFGQNQIQCMLCSNQGTVSVQNGQPVFDIRGGPHELFLTLDDALQHRQWLKSMKSRFLAEKEKLKPISQAYRKQGKWVKPDRDLPDA